MTLSTECSVKPKFLNSIPLPKALRDFKTLKLFNQKPLLLCHIYLHLAPDTASGLLWESEFHRTPPHPLSPLLPPMRSSHSPFSDSSLLASELSTSHVVVALGCCPGPSKTENIWVYALSSPSQTQITRTYS